MKTKAAASSGERPRTLGAELRAADAGKIESLARADLEAELDFLLKHIEGIELAVKGMQAADNITSPRAIIALAQSAQDRCAGILAAVGEARFVGEGAP